VPTDFDNRRDVDLLFARPGVAPALYQNRRDGTFRDVAAEVGLGGSAAFRCLAAGDFNKDSVVDFFFGVLDGPDVLALSDGKGRFKPGPAPAGSSGTLRALAFDYDNDGLLDIIVVNGHVYPQLDKAKLGASAGYRQRKLLYHNRGDGTFDEVAARFGKVMMEERASRGLAVGDLDLDGRLDLVMNDLDGSPQILRNEIAGAGNWILVKLTGKGSNLNAIGAVITVRAGKLVATRLVQSGTSYLSQDDMRQHVGLGSATQADSIEVRWPDGTTTKQEKVKANQIVEIAQR
jgi:hypothetical protein